MEPVSKKTTTLLVHAHLALEGHSVIISPQLDSMALRIWTSPLENKYLNFHFSSGQLFITAYWLLIQVTNSLCFLITTMFILRTMKHRNFQLGRRLILATASGTQFTSTDLLTRWPSWWIIHPAAKTAWHLHLNKHKRTLQTFTSAALHFLQPMAVIFCIILLDASKM